MPQAKIGVIGGSGLKKIFGNLSPRRVFDLTPHHYITTIITENGIIREPYGEGIKGLSNGK